MRQIKYRAKSIDTGNWVYGGYYEADGQAVILHVQGRNLMQHTSVDPDTAGQWTGKQDKNGTEVYEGDKLVDDEYIYMQVNWDDKNARFSVDGYGPAMYRNEGSGEEYTQKIYKLDTEVIDMQDIAEYELTSWR